MSNNPYIPPANNASFIRYIVQSVKAAYDSESFREEFEAWKREMSE